MLSVVRSSVEMSQALIEYGEVSGSIFLHRATMMARDVWSFGSEHAVELGLGLVVAVAVWKLFRF